MQPHSRAPEPPGHALGVHGGSQCPPTLFSPGPVGSARQCQAWLCGVRGSATTHRLPEMIVFHCHMHRCIYTSLLLPSSSSSRSPRHHALKPLVCPSVPVWGCRHHVPPPVSERSQARMREGLEAAAEGPGRLSVPASIWFVRPGSDGHSHPICCWGQAPSAAPLRPSVTLEEGSGAERGGQGAWLPQCGLG